MTAADIDILEAIQKKRDECGGLTSFDVDNLIAAVEALRERAAELEKTSKYWMNEATTGLDQARARITWKDRAEIAEAKVEKLEQQHAQDMADAAKNGADTKRAWDLKAAAETINRDMAEALEGLLSDVRKLLAPVDTCQSDALDDVPSIKRARAVLKKATP
jgi:protein subunit release factor A